MENRSNNKKINNKKNIIGTSIKAGVSIFFVYLIVRKVNWSGLSAVIMNTDLFFLLLSFLLSPIMVLVSAWKWHLLLRPHRITVPFSRLFVLYYIGYMFNNVLPSNVGGDVIVSYELAKFTRKPFDSVASVLMNRFTGLVVLVPAALLAFMINNKVFMDYRIASMMGAIVVALCLVLWFIVDSRPMRTLEKVKIRGVAKGVTKFKKLQEALRVYRNETGILWRALAISVLFFLLMVVNVYVGCLAFSVSPSVVQIFVILPFLQVVSMLPIALGGVGLREWAYMIAFPQIGIASTVGLSVILLLRVKAIVNGLVGGALYPMLGRGKGNQYAEQQGT